MSVSVVIPTYQRAAAVRRLIESLYDQTIPASDFEAVVVVDGSTDGTEDMLAALRPPYELRVASQPNRGRAAACNTGIAHAAGEVVVLLDDDMIATRGLLEAHARRHAGGLRGIVGAVELLVPHDSPPLVWFVAAYWRQRMERLSTSDRLRFSDAYTGNFSAPRALLAELRFDEDFTRYGHEDYELALRLVATGARLEFEAAALAYHAYVKDLAGVARDELARGRTAVLLARKHPQAVDELQLARRRSGSRTWRAARELLIRVTVARPELALRVLRAFSPVTRRRLREVDYNRITDYFFWLGARQALGEEGGTPPAREARSFT